MVNVWKSSMVFMLSFQMSFVAQKISDTKFTGVVQIVLLQQSNVVTPCCYIPANNYCYALLLQIRWKTVDTVVPLTTLVYIVVDMSSSGCTIVVFPL